MNSPNNPEKTLYLYLRDKVGQVLTYNVKEQKDYLINHVLFITITRLLKNTGEPQIMLFVNITEKDFKLYIKNEHIISNEGRIISMYVLDFEHDNIIATVHLNNDDKFYLEV